MNYVDPELKCAFVYGYRVDLTAKQFQICEYLARKPGVPHSAQQLLSHMGCPYARFGVATDWIKRIRAKGVLCIQTRPGIGYTWLE